MYQDEGDQRKYKPKEYGSGGKSVSQKLQKEDKTKSQTAAHTEKKKPLEEIAPSLLEAWFENGDCARSGKENYRWKFCWQSILYISSKGKWPKSKNGHEKDSSFAAGTAGNQPQVEVSASQRVNVVDLTNKKIIDWRTL